ncbi:TetR family transcriptional regulator [Kribbella capetownensis]|uniref:TetR family transcriptional regulator n=1 Tax=Kribbella capetownensis TaxID=1572659 RepID=A0A4R0JM56_9ACTN|nr:TetR family transcriptional regulator [Kribbella capetownensis]TCC47430.1 TetR family transcriptional regulator [Kribbella capetownensis]
MPDPSTGRGPGRRPGRPGTRDEILTAARRLFAERGYAGTTIRATAAAAAVDPSLVHHYIGTKEGLSRLAGSSDRSSSRSAAGHCVDCVHERQ